MSFGPREQRSSKRLLHHPKPLVESFAPVQPRFVPVQEVFCSPDAKTCCTLSFPLWEILPYRAISLVRGFPMLGYTPKGLCNNTPSEKGS